MVNSSDQSINADLCNEVEQPDKDANSDDAADDNGCIFQNLLGGGPNDLLQLTAELTEVLADLAPGSFEPVFLFDFCHFGGASLLGLVVSGVLSAESAVLLHFETVRVILLVLHGVVVSLLALRASQSDFNAHNGTSLKLPPCITPSRVNLASGQLHFRFGAEKWAQKNNPFFTGKDILPWGVTNVNKIFLYFLTFLVYNGDKYNRKAEDAK